MPSFFLAQVVQKAQSPDILLLPMNLSPSLMLQSAFNLLWVRSPIEIWFCSESIAMRECLL
jgi:hypothetical protein